MATVPNPVSKEQYDILDALLKTKWEGMLQAQSRLINWLFAVPGAGIAGTLTYAAKAGSTPSLLVALISFGLGLVVIILYGTAMYYAERKNVIGFKGDMDKFLSTGSITWEDIFKNDYLRPVEHKIGEVFAWISALCSLSGMTCLIITVLSR